MPRMNVKPLVRRAVTSTAPRFEARFVNGQWTAFDRVNFGHGPAVGTRRELDRIVRELNEGTLRWAA